MFDQIKQFATSLMTRLAVTREDGQAMVEYSLILALISVVAIGTLIAIGGGVSAALTTVEEALNGL